MGNLPSYLENNETYKDLHEDIENLKEWLDEHESDHKKYAEKAEKLHKKEQRLEKLEKSLRETAEKIKELSESNSSERLKKAINLFNAGDVKGAANILNLNEIEKDASKNIEIILRKNTEELKLSIKVLINEKPEGWEEEIIKKIDLVAKCPHEINKENELADFYRKIGNELLYEYDSLAMRFLNMERKIREQLKDSIKLAECDLLRAQCYNSLGIRSEAIEIVDKILKTFPKDHPGYGKALNMSIEMKS